MTQAHKADWVKLKRKLWQIVIRRERVYDRQLDLNSDWTDTPPAKEPKANDEA